MNQEYEIVGDDKLWEIPSGWTHGNQSDEYGCHRCGKKVGKHPAQIHVVAGGGTLLSAEYGIDKFSQYDDESGHEEAGGDMYWFPIGSECKKHVPAEFVSEPQS
tara:strand:- start:2721 stop:3032 length:312 start_codon:yes stop_codon:yes gene_type:complete